MQLWCIDVGNTQTVVGIHDGTGWLAVWRLGTSIEVTEDELAVAISGLCTLKGIPFQGSGLIVGSVVPGVEDAWRRFADKHLDLDAVFLRDGASVGLPVSYQPPNAVGADRIANALGALELYAPPIVVVDFGTATTFDCVDASGTYAGGVIMAGPVVALQALVGRTSKLPNVAFEPPATVIGKETTTALQSGAVLGYADAIQGLALRIVRELGPGTSVMSTGGLGESFSKLCPSITNHLPTLTLDGLRIAYSRLVATKF